MYNTYGNVLSLGNFRPGEQGTILKKLGPKERTCLRELMVDVLRPYVPEYKGEVDCDGDRILLTHVS